MDSRIRTWSWVVIVVAMLTLGETKPDDREEMKGLNDLDSDSEIPDVRAFIESLSQEEKQMFKRIIGGEEIETGEWPWLVKIKAKIEKKFFGITVSSTELHCTASLLNDRWILTAAHCFKYKNLPQAMRADLWTATMGDAHPESGIIDSFFGWWMDLFTDAPEAFESDGELIVIHPNYVDSPQAKWQNDIALMKLEDAVPSSADDEAHVQAVTLPKQGGSSFPDDGALCIMKGWGCTVAGGSVAEHARAVEMPKVSDSVCYNMWYADTTTRLCAGYNLQAMGICSGDSGGPLVSQNDAGVYVQVGIASFASADAPAQFPGVFTRVSHYVDWIEGVIQNN